MSFPKFVVGEVVILDSSKVPEYNGEHTVVGITKLGDVYKGKTMSYGDPDVFYYDLGFDTPYMDGYSVWHEGVLRKKHEPGEFSFDELMTILKQRQEANI